MSVCSVLYQLLRALIVAIDFFIVPTVTFNILYRFIVLLHNKSADYIIAMSEELPEIIVPDLNANTAERYEVSL